MAQPVTMDQRACSSAIDVIDRNHVPDAIGGINGGLHRNDRPSLNL
jgi:hypothetical protein